MITVLFLLGAIALLAIATMVTYLDGKTEVAGNLFTVLIGILLGSAIVMAVA